MNNTGNTSPGVPRLGLPAYQWWLVRILLLAIAQNSPHSYYVFRQEALHGVASSPGVNFSTSGNYSYATSFPQPILMGAAFDDELITAVATVVSTEARVFNNANRAGLDFWTPNINPFKDPRWGRGQGDYFSFGEPFWIHPEADMRDRNPWRRPLPPLLVCSSFNRRPARWLRTEV